MSDPLTNPNLTPVTTFNAIVGAFIQDARRWSKLSQRDLAQQCGVPQSSISRIERGSNACSVSMLDNICQALRVSASTLLVYVECCRNALEYDDVGVYTGSLAELKKSGYLIVSARAIVTYIDDDDDDAEWVPGNANTRKEDK